MKNRLYIGIGGIAALFAVLFVFNIMTPTGAAVTDNTITGSDNSLSGSVEIPLSEITKTAEFRSLDVNGVDVDFFAVRGSDGNVRTAFDACDICGGSKGYRQEGNDMVCNNCGLHFEIDDIGTKNRGGGCWPSYLSHETDGDRIIISEAEIAAGKWRFA